jgi:hypothetical protein
MELEVDPWRTKSPRGGGERIVMMLPSGPVMLGGGSGKARRGGAVAISKDMISRSSYGDDEDDISGNFVFPVGVVGLDDAESLLSSQSTLSASLAGTSVASESTDIDTKLTSDGASSRYGIWEKADPRAPAPLANSIVCGSSIRGDIKPSQPISGCEIAEMGLNGGGHDGSPTNLVSDTELRVFARLCDGSTLAGRWRTCQLGHLLGPPFSTKGSSSCPCCLGLSSSGSLVL